MDNNNFSVLTRSGSNYGIDFLERLKKINIRPGLICVEETTFKSRFKMGRYLSKKIGVVDAFRYNLKIWLKPFIRSMTFNIFFPSPDYTQYSDNVVIADNINHSKIVKELKKFHYPKIILAQCGIIRKDILLISNKWIVNCHPGKIPYYRGVDCVRWSLLNGENIFITLHLVNEGIDTGNIIVQEEVPIFENDTIVTIEERANKYCLDYLEKAAINPIQSFPTGQTVNNNLGRQYYLMPFKVAKMLKRKQKEIISKLS